MTGHDTIVWKVGAAAVVSAWFIETGMNAMFGWSRGLGWAVGYVCIAVFGSVLGILFRSIRGNDWFAHMQRGAIAVPFIWCVMMSQIAGWSVAAIGLADGSVRRQTQADRGAAARDELKRLREQAAKVGVAVDPAQIEAQIAAALSAVVKGTSKTVAELSKNCADAAAAPSACRKVAELRIEAARARTSSDLPARIAEAAKAASAAPQLAEADPYLDNLRRVSGASDEDLKFWFMASFVGLLGIIANFGPAILFVAGAPAAPAMPETQRLLAAPPPSHWGDFYPDPYGNRFGGHSPIPGAAPGGAAINFHFQSPTAVASNHPSPERAAAPEAPFSPVPLPPIDPVSARIRASDAVMLPPVATERPADQSHVKRMIDQLVSFKAAQLVASPGAVVAVDLVWQRYVAWAGQRAMGRTMFEALFGDANGISSTGLVGEQMYHGVSLRPPVEAVA